MAEKLSIGEVARRAGVAPSALRYYEREGILPEAERVSGRRVYGSEVLTLLRMVSVAKQAGFTLDEIRTLCTAFPEETPPSRRWRQLADRKLDEVDSLIARAQAMKRILQQGLDCECVRLEDCVFSEDPSVSRT